MPQKTIESVALDGAWRGSALCFSSLCLLALASMFPDGHAASFSLSATRCGRSSWKGSSTIPRILPISSKQCGNRSGVRAVVLRINSPGGGRGGFPGDVRGRPEIPRRNPQEGRGRACRPLPPRAAITSPAPPTRSSPIPAPLPAASASSPSGTITAIFSAGQKWKSIVIKSGEFKDAGSPTRPLTEAERVYFQILIDNMYNQFVSAVAAGRKMKEDRLSEDSPTAASIPGQEAKENGLVDEVGNLQDAMAAAAKMAGISGEPRVVPPRRNRYPFWTCCSEMPGPCCL